MAELVSIFKMQVIEDPKETHDKKHLIVDS